MASSKTSIYAALIANLLIAVTKFIAGGISNSAAMVAEGVHSVVDTVNELFLLLGIHRSKKLPDATHPFRLRQGALLLVVHCFYHDLRAWWRHLHLPGDRPHHQTRRTWATQPSTILY
jgi:Co/Zn/Cd efflux system component